MALFFKHLFYLFVSSVNFLIPLAPYLMCRRCGLYSFRHRKKSAALFCENGTRSVSICQWPTRKPCYFGQWAHFILAMCCYISFLYLICVNLTNIFHVAVRLVRNRSQMTLKCGKNKKMSHEAIAKYVMEYICSVNVDKLLNVCIERLI